MAQVEPMDVDSIESDFDNKENAFHHNNVLPRTPCTEKGYEELDVSELNMKLRYSITPAASPMTKSLTGPCSDNRICSTEHYPNGAVGAENGNLTRSLNSSLNKTDGLSKSKVLPLQTLSTATFVDGNRNTTNRNQSVDPSEISVTLNSPTEIDENLSVPSTCSSIPDTPEATTPTKDIPKPDGSPIMRGLKSVLSMFRPSQSPITPVEENVAKQEIPSPGELNQADVNVQISTPVVSKHRDASSSKRSSPLKESLVFNDDLERELQWKDDSAIFIKGERVPVHKIFLNNPINEIVASDTVDTTVEYMDISANESNLENKTITSIIPKFESDNTEHHNIAGESDNEFLDCETTFSKNESYLIDCKKLEIENQVNDTENNLQKPSKEIATENQSTISPEEPSVTVCVEQPTPSVFDFQNTGLGNDTDNKTNSLTCENIDFNIPPDTHSSASKSENVDLPTTSQVNMESQILKACSTDTTLPIEEVKKDVVLNNCAKAPSPSKFNEKKYSIASENFDKRENNHGDDTSHQDTCNNIIFNIPQDCATILDNVKEFNNEAEQGTETNVKTETHAIVEDINSDLSTLDKEAENIERSNLIDSVPNLQQPSMNNNLESTNYVDREQGSEFLNMNKDSTFNTDNELPINNIFFTERQSSSILYENNKTIDNTPLRDLNEDDDSMLSKNTVDTSLQMQDKILIVPNNTNIAVFNSVTHSNMSHFDFESNLIIVPTEKSSEDNNSEENVKVVNSKDTSYICSMLSVLDNSSDNDRELSELPVGNDVTAKLSPSQIPLPDEDEIEQKLLANNIMYEEQDNRKDPANTTLEICTGRSVAAVEHELLKDCIEQNDISNSVEKNKESFINNDSQIEISGTHKLFEKDVDVIQTCIDQLAHTHTIEGGPIKTSNENIILDKASSVLQISHDTSLCEENPSKNTSMQEVLCNDQEFLKIPNNANKIIGTEVHSNAVTLSEIDLGDNIEPSNIHHVSEETSEPNNEALRDYVAEKEKHEIDKEIITSANNSPYVSVTDLATESEEILGKPEDEINNASATNSQAPSSSSISPKIVSKGYNFNFDDIDDPFATKTKIRLSPTPDAPNQLFDTFTKVKEASPKMSKQNKTRRISQAERKRPVSRKNMNKTYSEELKNKKPVSGQLMDSANCSFTNTDMKNISTSAEMNLPKAKPHNNIDQNLNKTVELDASESVTTGGSHVSSSVKKEEIQHEQNSAEEIKYLEKALIISTEKSTSSSEQYFSLGTSSGESNSLMKKSKNVFNLPEIDDMNFNPFATKSKMRMSPPPSTEKQINAIQSDNDVDNSSHVREQQAVIKVKDTFDKNVTRDTSPNTSIATCSSQNTNDRNVLDKEINTEDEDTIEGPFLEAEDFKERISNKMNDMETDTEMINFCEPNRQEKDENGENGELFIDADAFEFLLNQNKSTTVLDSGKESLFLKFDPLFSKRVSSDGILAAISKAQKIQSTPKKVTPIQNDLVSIVKPVAGSSHDNQNCGVNEDLNEDLSSNISKPMMVVNPAISSFMTQKKSVTPKLNRRSLTFTSPAIAVIDRLLSVSGNSSNLDYNPSIPQVGRAHTDTDLAITQLRELLAEKEINVHNLRTESKELKDRISVLEVQMRGLETESAKRLAKINELNDRLLEKTKMNKNMAIVVEEYERTIASLIAENEHDKKRNAEERMKLIKERDEQTTHLTSMEVSFSDLHSKYEKSKQIILTCKANEDICRKSIKEFQENLSKMQNNYELLKQHATSKLNHANQELEKMNRAHEAEVLKLSTMIKRKELHITSLEETLAQKIKTNEELTAICDELINKVPDFKN